MQLWSALKKQFLAARVGAAMKLLPDQRYVQWLPRSNKAPKQVLPKNPTVPQLRRFSQDPVVRKGITLIADAISTMPYEVYIVDGNKGKFKKQIRAVTNIIEQPNLVHSRKAFTKMLLDDAVVLDAMCAEVSKSSDSNHPIYLYPVDGSTIQMVVPRNYVDPKAPCYMQQQQDGMHYFTTEEVAYLQRQYFTYEPYGFSPVRSAYEYIKFYLESAQQTNKRTNNATADYIISLGEGVTEEMRKQFEEYFANEIEGTGKIPMINGTTTLSTKKIRDQYGSESYIKWMEKLTEIVGVAMGIPAEKLGVTVANDRSTGEDQENVVMQEAIKPYAAMMEDLYNNFVIKPMGLEGVLRFRFIFEDSEQQKTIKSKRVVDEYYKGCITENEFRSLMGYDHSDSPYADMTYPEKTATINVSLGIAGGFNGNGVTKDTSNDTPQATGDSSQYEN